MAGLVQRAEQTRERLVRIETRGDADVARHAFGERMLALIEAAAIEREAHAFMTSTMSALCLPGGNLPVSGGSGRVSCTAMASRMSDGRRRDSALNIASMSAVVMPGLNSSTSAS